MRRFADLFDALDSTTRTSGKLDALRRYFREAPARDAAWALALLSGGKLIRAIPRRRLRDWVVAETNLPEWLVRESYDVVGDLSETLALLLPTSEEGSDLPLHRVVEERIVPLPRMSESQRRETIVATWREQSTRQRFLYNKMILGSFRVGVAGKLVVRALAEVAGVDAGVMAHRLSGRWTPSEAGFQQLLAGETGAGDPARPYPFYLAYPLEQAVEELGGADEWQVEWKWDGIRAQLIHRAGHVMVWSRGDELITEGFPEVAALARELPEGTVLDGEILAWENGYPLPFALLQRRINRKREAPRLWDEVPVVFMAYDLLEWAGRDWRGEALSRRREKLEEVLDGCGDRMTDGTAGAEPGRYPRIAGTPFDAGQAPPGRYGDAGRTQPGRYGRHLRLSPVVAAEGWEPVRAAHGEARERGAEGLMIKRRSSPYGVGRQRGAWWKWKVDPYTLDAVLIYAQLGNGKRANLFTDYTFGVWDGNELVPVAKAYSGLTDEEIGRVDRFVRNHTIDKFGPVRVVKPELVFELAFENIQRSTRHKSGLALRFPRMARWRTDKPAAEADTLETLRALLRRQEG